MSRPDQEPMIDVAGGDPALSRHLRSCLKVLRDRTDNPEFRAFADEVMAGRRSLREAVTSPVFAHVLNPQVAQFAQRYEQLSDDERERLAAEGERQFAEQREQIARERRAAAARARRRDDPGDVEDFSQRFLAAMTTLRSPFEDILRTVSGMVDVVLEGRTTWCGADGACDLDLLREQRMRTRPDGF